MTLTIQEETLRRLARIVAQPKREPTIQQETLARLARICAAPRATEAADGRE